jgi:hypothetical protein
MHVSLPRWSSPREDDELSEEFVELRSILLLGPLFDSVDKIVVELACGRVRPARIRGNRLEDDRVGGCEPLCREGGKTMLSNSAAIRLTPLKSPN